MILFFFLCVCVRQISTWIKMRKVKVICSPSSATFATKVKWQAISVHAVISCCVSTATVPMATVESLQGRKSRSRQLIRHPKGAVMCSYYLLKAKVRFYFLFEMLICFRMICFVFYSSAS
jgi:hypothetical protein